jgi:hypothetical protein
LLLLGAILAGVVSKDALTAIICFRQTCPDTTLAETAVIAAFLAFLIGTLLACLSYLRDAERGALQAAAAAIAVFVTAAFMAVAHPEFGEQIQGYFAFYAFVLGLLVLIPLRWRPAHWTFERLIALYAQILAAMLIGAVIGAVVQLIGEILWVGFGDWGASKFVIAPSGTVIACAAWSTMLVQARDPLTFRDDMVARRSWLLFAIVGAVLLAVGQGPLFFLDKVILPTPGHWAAVTSAALLLPGITAAGMAFVQGPQGLRRTRTAPIVWAVAVLLTAVLAWELSPFLQYDDIPIAGDLRSRIAFVTSHAMATAGIGFSVLLAPRAMAWLHTLF